jgi:hypothetical protein
VLLKKFSNVGFEDVDVLDRRGFGLDDLTRYPLFAPDFLSFMRKVMPPDRHAEMVFSIVITARKPASPRPLGSRGESAPTSRNGGVL